MKKLSTLLKRRQALLRQTHLANLAFAYSTLSRFAARAERAQLGGTVTLKPVAPHAERFCAALVAIDGHQSVIEEHFTDEDVMELADVLAFVTGDASAELTFRLEEIAEAFLGPLRVELENEGVSIDPTDARRDALR